MSSVSVLNFSEYKTISNEEIVSLSNSILISEYLSENGIRFLQFLKGESIDYLVRGIYSGRNIANIYNYSDDDLEKQHDYIQWLFPTITLSSCNFDSPNLTLSDYEILRADWSVRKLVYYLAIKLLNYWGFYDNNRNKLNLLHGHNGLRLSRLIECLTLFWFDISWIIVKINELIEAKILFPKYTIYNNERTPIWIVRYLENKDK